MEEQKLIKSPKTRKKSSTRTTNKESTNKIHPKTQEFVQPTEKTSLGQEIETYAKEAAKEHTEGHDLLKRLKDKVKDLTEDRIFKEKSSIGSLLRPEKIILSSDNTLMVAALKNHSIGIYRRDRSTGLFYQDHEVKGPAGKSSDFAFNQDETQIVVASDDGKVRILKKSEETRRFTVAEVIETHNGRASSVSISRNDQFIISGGQDKLVKIWRFDHLRGVFKLHQSLEGHNSSLSSVKFIADDQSISSVSIHNKILIWKKKTDGSERFELDQKIEDFSESSQKVWVCQSGNRIFVADRVLSVTIWDRRGGVGQPLTVFQTIKPSSISIFMIQSIFLSEDEKTFLVASLDHFGWLWKEDPESKQFVLCQKWKVHESTCQVIVLSHDESLLVSGSKDEEIKVWMKDGPSSHFELRQTLGHRWLFPISSIAVSEDLKTIASCSRNASIKIWLRVAEYGFAQFQEFEAEAERISGVKILNEGKLIVSTSDEGVIELWRKSVVSERFEPWKKIQLKNHARKQPQKSHERDLIIPDDDEAIPSLAEFSSDGKTMITGLGSLSLQVWNLLEGEVDHILEDYQSVVSAVVLSQNRQSVIAGCSDGSIILRREAAESCKFKLFQKLEAHSDSILSLRTTQEGYMIASLSKDNTLKIWRAEKADHNPAYFELTQSITTNKNMLKFSMDHSGRMILRGGVGSSIQVLVRDPETHQFNNLQNLVDAQDHFKQAIISEDSNSIVFLTEEENIIIWSRKKDLEDNLMISTQLNPDQGLHVMACDQTRHLFCSGGDKYLKIYKNRGELGLETIQATGGHTNNISCVKLSRDAKTAVSAGYDRYLVVWKVEEETSFLHAEEFLEHKNGLICCLDMNQEEGIIVCGAVDATVTVWTKNQETSKYGFEQTLRGYKITIRSISLSHDASIIASGSNDTEIRLWKKEPDSFQFNCFQTLKGHQAWVLSLDFSPDGRFLVSCGDQKKIIIWSQKSELYEKSQTINAETSLTSISLSRDAQTLVAASLDHTVTIYAKNHQKDHFSVSQTLEFSSRITQAKVSQMGSFFITVLKNRGIIISKKNKQTGRYEIGEATEMDKNVSCIDISANKASFFLGTSKHLTYLYEREQPSEKFVQTHQSNSHGTAISHIAMSKKGDMVVTASES